MYRNEPNIVVEKPQEASFTGYATNEDLLNKLKLLKYNSEFISKLKMKPIHRYYFIIPKNPGEQFFVFSQLASWLINKSGRLFEQPQEYDDPNTVINNILEVVRENGVTIDFAPNKLKQGVGEHVIFVLDHLADQALQRAYFNWERPQIPQEEQEEIEIIEDESEINLDRVEEEMLASYVDDSDDEGAFHIDDFNQNKQQIKAAQEIVSTVSSEMWKLELERVLPQLKVTIKSESRDWRFHLEQMKGHRESIEKCLSSTKIQLQRLHKDISGNLEKISNRERFLNRELEPVLEEYRTLQDYASKIKENYKQISGGVTERTRELSNFTEKLESIKQQMEERGSSMTDGTPLVNIKKSITRVKAEITEMDVRIGVLECMLLQTKVNDKRILEEDLNQSAVVF